MMMTRTVMTMMMSVGSRHELEVGVALKQRTARIEKGTLEKKRRKKQKRK